MLDDLAKSQLVVAFRGPIVDSMFSDQARLNANGSFSSYLSSLDSAPVGICCPPIVPPGYSVFEMVVPYRYATPAHVCSHASQVLYLKAVYAMPSINLLTGKICDRWYSVVEVIHRRVRLHGSAGCLGWSRVILSVFAPAPAGKARLHRKES